jgi:hypothetical protein
VKGAGPAPQCDVAPERTRIMLDIPERERNCRSLLLEGNLKPSRLWRWSTLSRPRAPYPSVEDFPTYIMIRMSFEILQYNLRLFSPLTDVGRRFAATSMSSAEINIPDQAESLRLLKEDMAKKRAAAQKRKAAGKVTGGTSTAPEKELETSSDKGPSKKKQRTSVVDRQKKVVSGSKQQSSEAAFKPDSSMELLAAGLSSFKEPAAFLERADDFTLPLDNVYLKGLKTEEVFNTVLLNNYQVKWIYIFFNFTT